MIEIKRTPVVDTAGWRFDMENAPRNMAEWLFIAVEIDGVRQIRNGRWSSDRWMTPAGFVSPRAVYAWTRTLEPPEPPAAFDPDADAMSLV